jgi:hypothetical protein
MKLIPISVFCQRGGIQKNLIPGHHTHSFQSSTSKTVQNLTQRKIYHLVAPYHSRTLIATKQRCRQLGTKRSFPNFSTPSQNYVLVRPIKWCSAGHSTPRSNTKNSSPSFQLACLHIKGIRVLTLCCLFTTWDVCSTLKAWERRSRRGGGGMPVYLLADLS